MAANCDIFAYTLTSAELARIDDLDTGVRSGGRPEIFDRVVPED